LNFTCDPTCQECKGAKNTDCTHCHIGAELIAKDGRCVCKEGYVEHKNHRCEKIKCHHSCDVCVGSKETDCIKCKRNAVLEHDGSCDCPAPMVEWATDPYVCDLTFVDFLEAAEDESQTR